MEVHKEIMEMHKEILKFGCYISWTREDQKNSNNQNQRQEKPKLSLTTNNKSTPKFSQWKFNTQYYFLT